MDINQIDQESKKWLDKKLKSFSICRELCLKEMLYNTTLLIEQAANCDFKTKAANEALISAIKHNFLFLNSINNENIKKL